MGWLLGLPAAAMSVVYAFIIAVSGITKMSITGLTVAVMPWLLTMLASLGLVTYVPEISLGCRACLA